MKYDREICIRALLPFRLPDVILKSILVIHKKKKKIKSFPHRQKSEANVSVNIQDGPPNIDILVIFFFDVFNSKRHQKSHIFNPLSP